jgi:hypothetical protein
VNAKYSLAFDSSPSGQCAVQFQVLRTIHPGHADKVMMPKDVIASEVLIDLSAVDFCCRFLSSARIFRRPDPCL